MQIWVGRYDFRNNSDAALNFARSLDQATLDRLCAGPFTVDEIPPQCTHLRWWHPGRMTAILHLMPTVSRFEFESGRVAFTSGMNRRMRSEFDGYYDFVRSTPSTLYVQFRYCGEHAGEVQLIDHYLTMTHNGEHCATLRDHRQWVTAEIVPLADIWVDSCRSDAASGNLEHALLQHGRDPREQDTHGQDSHGQGSAEDPPSHQDCRV